MSSEAERIIEIYQRHAQAFDRRRTRALFEKSWLDRFLAATPRERAILDLGCGSGEPIERYLIEQDCTITGVDTSAALLQLAARRFPEHEWLSADMRGLSLGRRFSGILAWDSFFHLTPENQREMFRVFRAHAASNAVLMFTSGPAADVRIGDFEGEPLYHASLDPDEYRELLRAHAFVLLAFAPEDPECHGHTVWLAKARPR